jgi:hypothetical protein
MNQKGMKIISVDIAAEPPVQRSPAGTLQQRLTTQIRFIEHVETPPGDRPACGQRGLARANFTAVVSSVLIFCDVDIIS